MKQFESGISGYIKGSAIVSNFFPIDFRGNALIVCDMCRFYRKSANRCGLTEEIIPWPEKYVGKQCPLKQEDES